MILNKNNLFKQSKNIEEKLNKFYLNTTKALPLTFSGNIETATKISISYKNDEKDVTDTFVVDYLQKNLDRDYGAGKFDVKLSGEKTNAKAIGLKLISSLMNKTIYTIEISWKHTLYGLSKDDIDLIDVVDHILIKVMENYLNQKTQILFNKEYLSATLQLSQTDIEKVTQAINTLGYKAYLLPDSNNENYEIKIDIDNEVKITPETESKPVSEHVNTVDDVVVTKDEKPVTESFKEVTPNNETETVNKESEKVE